MKCCGCGCGCSLCGMGLGVRGTCYIVYDTFPVIVISTM